MKNIIDTAVGDPQFSTLVTAIKTANLVDTLSGAGPFTINRWEQSPHLQVVL